MYRVQLRWAAIFEDIPPMVELFGRPDRPSP
ncbi:hypothetical protein PENFLA_c003G08675 [Penicillium flavigenum]|uniref:Uncharacterized protein n=1 Tax=Penicillium flavigenum TaxID=254877 RepID=A0A1V6TUY4_9EURO|nr:hypothetical protein PENFLA_c003G08675 [Penicillium flavigenum]